MTLRKAPALAQMPIRAFGCTLAPLFYKPSLIPTAISTICTISRCPQIMIRNNRLLQCNQFITPVTKSLLRKMNPTLCRVDHLGVEKNKNIFSEFMTKQCTP